MSGKKRERDSKNSAVALFSAGSGKRSFGSKDKPQKGTVMDLNFGLGGANDLLAKLDEETDSSNSSTDDLERQLSEKDDLLSMLGGSDSGSDSSSSTEEDELADLLRATPTKVFAAPKGRAKITATAPQSVFNLFGFGSGETKKVITTGADGTHTPDPSGLTVGFGNSEDTNVEGYRRKKKKGRYFAFDEGSGGYEMQDTHYCEHSILEDVNLYCVFDGHSKSDCSNKLIEIFPRILKNHINNQGLSSDMTGLWLELFREVDSELIEFEESGATGTAVLIWRYKGKKYLQSANVGDSFSFLYRAGQPIWLSAAHRLSNPDERQRLLDLGEEISQNQTRLCGLNVCRVFGDHFGKSVTAGIIVDPHVSPVLELTADDTHMILASDGLWDVVEEDEAYDIVTNLEDAQDMSYSLIKTALRRPECQDNITVIVVKLV